MSNTLFINEEINLQQFMDIISRYYSIKMRQDVKFESELEVKYDSVSVYPELNIYYVSYIRGEKIRTLLKYEELFEPLNNYAKRQGLELINFEYNGGVRKMGLDEDTPYLNGVCLHMKECKLIKRLFRMWYYGRTFSN